MNTIPITTIIIAIFATAGLYHTIKKLYKSFNRLIDDKFVKWGKFNKQWISTENKIFTLEKRHSERMTKSNLKLHDVEKMANNFERDMNKYNDSIVRDNVAFTSKYNGVMAKFKKGLGNAFQQIKNIKDVVEIHREEIEILQKRAGKLADSDAGAYQLQLTHAKLISAVEKRLDKLEGKE